VSSGGESDILPLDEAMVLFREAEEERADVDQRLHNVLSELGFKGTVSE
jgi:type I restriction enzyme M protein